MSLGNPTATDATNVVAEIGLPPGCQVEETDLRGPRPARVERGEGKLVVYVDRLPGSAKLDYTLAFTPRFRLDVHTQPSRAYEYYVPEEAVTVPPAKVRAE